MTAYPKELKKGYMLLFRMLLKTRKRKFQSRKKEFLRNGSTKK